MIYVISDLHGYPLEKLKKLLQTACFGHTPTRSFGEFYNGRTLKART